MTDLPHLQGYIEQLGKPETLELAIAERDAWVESAAQFSRNEEYYRGLVVTIGEAIGEDSYIADDGSRSQDVLCDKIPSLVSSLLSTQERLRAALEPFATAASVFDFAVGPDGIDDGLTVIASTVARPEYEATLSTADFSAARAALSPINQEGV